MDSLFETIKRVAIPISLGLSLTTIGASYKITQYVVETARHELSRLSDRNDELADAINTLSLSQQSLSIKQKYNEYRIEKLE